MTSSSLSMSSLPTSINCTWCKKHSEANLMKSGNFYHNSLKYNFITSHSYYYSTWHSLRWRKLSLHLFYVLRKDMKFQLYVDFRWSVPSWNMIHHYIVGWSAIVSSISSYSSLFSSISSTTALISLICIFQLKSLSSFSQCNAFLHFSTSSKHLIHSVKNLYCCTSLSDAYNYYYLQFFRWLMIIWKNM